MDEPKTDQLLAGKDVCRILKISKYTLLNLHQRGVLPKVKISPRLIRYRLSDVESLIERRTLI